ncbi:MAG: ABC transporter ATP-binding protein [Anaerolineae bacterium]|nr:ABC transporter ATP-binding protein [Thermoflexales bacterium]MDW8407229.1 ABC transporter ATP-binding protein [Anaerolineae bacterium]
MSAAIITHNLTRRFGDKIAVDGLTLEVRVGEVFGFLGHNGAGKTTTVRLLNGVLEPHAGKAYVLGLDPLADGPALRARTGVLTESAALDARLSGRENLLVYADLFGVPQRQSDSRVSELLDFFGLSDSADLKVAAYSTGMRQRLALARTLLHDPELLFLDEPTAGLDPLAARQTHRLIAALARQKGRTVFLCTHNLVEAQRLCDRVGVMERGRLVAVGTPTELAARYVQQVQVEIEIAAEHIEAAIELLSHASGLLTARPQPSADQAPGGPLGALSLRVTGREAIPDMLALLTRHGVRVYRLTPHEPSLEDVYFALHAGAAEPSQQEHTR